jgi:hypothetical protein
MIGTMRRTLAALLLAAALSACGGDGGEREPVSADEYRRVLATASRDFGTKIDDVEDFDTTGAETKAEGKRLLEALRRQVDVLDEVEPPEDVAAPHEDLVEGLDSLADHVESELEALEHEAAVSGDEVEYRLLSSPSVEPTFQKLEAAGRQLVEAGYAPAAGAGG